MKTRKSKYIIVCETNQNAFMADIATYQILFKVLSGQKSIAK